MQTMAQATEMLPMQMMMQILPMTHFFVCRRKAIAYQIQSENELKCCKYLVCVQTAN